MVSPPRPMTSPTLLLGMLITSVTSWPWIPASKQTVCACAKLLLLLMVAQPRLMLLMLPPPPPTFSISLARTASTLILAISTASGLPVILSGFSAAYSRLSWMMTILAPVSSWSALMISPPLPIILATKLPGIIISWRPPQLVSVGKFPLIAALSFSLEITLLISSLARAIASKDPVSVHILYCWSRLSWSIWILHLLSLCSLEICSPPRPMMRPTMASGTRTCSDVA